jgi:hypothetical protein
MLQWALDCEIMIQLTKEVLCCYGTENFIIINHAILYLSILLHSFYVTTVWTSGRRP